MRSRCIFAALACILLAGCNRDPKTMRDRCLASADKYLQNGKYKEASILYRRALQFDPKYADTYYRLGKVQLVLQQYGDAARAFERASSLDPTNEDAASRLAEIYIAAYVTNPQSNKQALQEAKSLVAQIARRNPNSYGALRLEADLATIANDTETALSKLQQADQVKPWQPEIILPLMQALAGSGRQAEAEKLGEEFIARNRTVSSIYDLLFSYYRQDSRFDRAETILKEKTANLPYDPASRLELAAFYYGRGRRTEMLGALEALRSDTKAFPHPDGLIGDFYMRIGEFDSALRSYQDGEKHEPKLAIDYQKRASDVLIAQGREQEALAIVSAVHKKDPKDLEAAAIHASLRAKTDPREIQTAIDELEALTAKQNGNAMLQFHLARAYWMNGDPASLDKALQHFQTSVKLNAGFLAAKLGLAQVQMALGQNGAAVQTAEEILASNPLNLSAKLTRAAGLVNLGQPDKARTELTSALAINKNSNDARYQLATLNLTEKRYRDAEAGFQELAQSGDARGVIGLAKSKQAEGQPALAAQLLEQDLAKHPDHDTSRLALADLLTEAGRLQQARAHLEQLAQKTGGADVQIRLGTLQRTLGDKSAALQSFQTARRLQPSNSAAVLGHALLLDEAGQKEQARAAYEDLLKLDPTNPAALNNLAYLKAEQGVDLDQALAYAQRALQRSPDDPNISDTLGLIYIRKKLSDQAIAVLRDLVARVPDNPSFHLHLGMALFDAGQKQLAKKELEKALAYRPSAAQQAQIKELFARIG